MVNDSIIKKLMSSVKCAVCGQHYEADSIKILGHKEGLWLLGVSCLVCHTQCLAAAVIEEDTTSKIITDLTEAEQGKFRSMDRLNANDVLDMHNFLENFNGDFSLLFSTK